MNESARRALTLRQALAKSSVSKLEALAVRVSPDARCRYNYKYHGAHTARWTGEGVQLQNLPRGTVEDVPGATAAILAGDCSAFGNPLDVVSSCLRSAFQAPDGYRFVVSDLSQVEVRVLAWLADCKPLLSDLAAGDADKDEDVYKVFARKHLYRKQDISKHERQVSKSGVLGCGFGAGGGEEKVDKNGDAFKSGLWGYAAGMGIEITKEEAWAAVAAYREAYAAVPALWKALENAAARAVAFGEPTVGRRVSVGVAKHPWPYLWVGLPSGRRLHYVRPRIEEGKWPDGQPKRVIRYEGVDSKTKQWNKWLETYGGKLTENVVQAIARDCLGEGMLRAEAAGFEICGHTHDEIITLVPDCMDAADAELSKLMASPMPWAPDLLLAADGWTGKTYRK